MKSGTFEKAPLPTYAGWWWWFVWWRFVWWRLLVFDKRLGVFIDWGFAVLFWSFMEFYGNGGTS